MTTFLGIGAGPIQTGIFVAGAAAMRCERIVLVDVDESLVDAIQRSGSVTVNTSGAESVTATTFNNVVALHPERDHDAVVEAASYATYLATALPATRFYANVAPWLREAFFRVPQKIRYVYTAENSTTAAHELAELVGDFPNTFYLDTVIGKMSQVFETSSSSLPPLVAGYARGHLVEEFHTIYSSHAPGIETNGLAGLTPKRDLRPFEEAKLYGHNATHLVLGVWANQRGCRVMSDIAAFPDLVARAEEVLINECGRALCKRFAGADDFFRPATFAAWGRELVARMISPTLSDSVERVLRDIDRKLAPNDRLLGAIRLCVAEGVAPTLLVNAARDASKLCAHSAQFESDLAQTLAHRE
ncbi:MAG: hypothetical protein ACRC46_12160 [Thermoguttaceae bacterium]